MLVGLYYNSLYTIYTIKNGSDILNAVNTTEQDNKVETILAVS